MFERVLEIQPPNLVSVCTVHGSTVGMVGHNICLYVHGLLMAITVMLSCVSLLRLIVNPFLRQ